ncbi:globin [Paenibacillus aurantius]|uniref:Globin n=1 Tax=Paenibacillus aurantius TaxID=2918900 RepID=A0AA96RGQ8_9BACL|nr:globin [Paenibacillus aurantius]WJH32209.1 globin [Paenibacillus sp. CC-CFT747]WNQ12583.1 globin [Paenibacillus aurantius]
MPDNREFTLYEAIGGEKAVRKLVNAFYPLVQANPLIGPLFPDDIEPVREKQFLFLTQFFGGPPLYSERYGHPMMRARHLPFPITPERADAWLGCMSRALDSLQLEEDLKGFVLERLKAPAYHFINS